MIMGAWDRAQLYQAKVRIKSASRKHEMPGLPPSSLGVHGG